VPQPLESDRSDLQEPPPGAENAGGTAAWKRARKVAVAIMGVTVLLVSIPVGLIPGPGGIFVALGGLAILATEFVWAKRLLRKLKEKAKAAGEAVGIKGPR
jgi:hypothetical protein